MTLSHTYILDGIEALEGEEAVSIEYTIQRRGVEIWAHDEIDNLSSYVPEKNIPAFIKSMESFIADLKADYNIPAEKPEAEKMRSLLREIEKRITAPGNGGYYADLGPTIYGQILEAIK